LSSQTNRANERRVYKWEGRGGETSLGIFQQMEGILPRRGSAGETGVPGALFGWAQRGKSGKLFFMKQNGFGSREIRSGKK